MMEMGFLKRCKVLSECDRGTQVASPVSVHRKQPDFLYKGDIMNYDNYDNDNYRHKNL